MLAKLQDPIILLCPFIERVHEYTHKGMVGGSREILSLLKAESVLFLKLIASTFDDR